MWNYAYGGDNFEEDEPMIIPVRTVNGDYDIILQNGVLQRAGEFLNLNRKVLILTDDGVPECYAAALTEKCREPYVIRISHGENAKCVRNWEDILKTMMQSGFTRGDCLAAVGGGVMGDLGGFAAACYMRGIDFYNIPTTLLAQVDSSVGGKTAVDFYGMKNLVGCFYPPARVLIDPEILKTLNRRELAAGMAEVIKIAAACDAELFETLESGMTEQNDAVNVIRRALDIKKRIVEEDPYETGIRKVLNFGHTIGHAVESLEGGKLLHGECVALGMLAMSKGEAQKRIRCLLQKWELPIQYNRAGPELLPALVHDKKNAENGITAVEVNNIGSYRFRIMSPEELCMASEVLK